jgi:GxxExxY protein
MWEKKAGFAGQEGNRKRVLVATKRPLFISTEARAGRAIRGTENTEKRKRGFADRMTQYQEITYPIIAAAMEVHKILGPGLLESAYKSCMMLEFEQRGLRFKEEMVTPFFYKGRKIDAGFRIDFLVEEKVIVELKSVETILPVHEAQLLTYLRLCQCQVGLLINFNVAMLKDGVRRCSLFHAKTDLTTAKL